MLLKSKKAVGATIIAVIVLVVIIGIIALFSGGGITGSTVLIDDDACGPGFFCIPGARI